MNHQIATWLLPLAIATVLAACNRTDSGSTGAPAGSQGDRSGVTNAQPTTPATVSPLESTIPRQVVDQLADAWCEQQRGCDQVGSGRRYSAFFECLAQARGSVRADLAAFNCPHGIDSTRTPPCMAEIERQDCTHDLVSLLSLAQCGSENVCAR